MAVIPAVTVSGQISICGYFDQEDVEYLDEDKHNKEMARREFKKLLKYFGLGTAQANTNSYKIKGTLFSVTAM